MRVRSNLNRAARAAAVAAGVLMALLGLPWAATAIYIGPVEPLILITVGPYAIVLLIVAFKLVRGSSPRIVWSLLGVLGALSPLALASLLTLINGPVARDPGESDGSALVMFSSAVAVVAFLAAALNWQVERMSTGGRSNTWG
jgi:hypothetical protein